MMSTTTGHDLQFEVQNGDGRSGERAVRGELDHLPDTGGNGGNGGAAAVTKGGLQFIQEQLKQSSHPTVIIFHVLFKASAYVLYIFGYWIAGKHDKGARFITLTVACILLLAADFWVVKNVTGRLLVGLRWWNKVQDEDTVWIFESAEDKAVNKFDRTVFWTVLYATPVVWAVQLLLETAKFALDWLLIPVIALALSMANVYGYYKCSKEQAAQFQQMMQAGAQQGAMAVVRSNILSVLTGTNTTAPNSSRNIV